MTWNSSWLIFAATIVLSNAGCAFLTTKNDDTVTGKVYISDPRQGGIVRAQTGEVIPYSKTKGFYSISPDDLELFLAQWEAAQQCEKK